MKHRLVGAVILVSAAVLVIPWLLSGPDRGAGVGDNAVISEIIPLPVTVGGEVGGDEAAKQQPADGATRSALLDGSDGWVVRVGTFSKQANADAVAKRLSKNGFTVHKDAVKTATGDATRIWLGPYAEKQTAGEVSARLKTLIGEKGYVTGYAP